MPIITKVFEDVEHYGDVAEIKTVVTEHGGIILNEEFNTEDETLVLKFKVADAGKFFNDTRDEPLFD